MPDGDRMIAAGVSDGRPIAERVGAWVLLTFFGALLALCAAKVAALGLFCADDGYFATISKNLAMGPGYGTTVYAEGFRPFHPEIGAGPALVLPVAAALRLIGNLYWVPGATTVGLWALLLVLAYRQLRHTAEARNVAFASAVFLAGIVLLFPYYFGAWFTMLGEVPTAAYLLLAVLFLARAELSRRSVAIASLVCSLAYSSKILCAIYCASFFVGLLLRVRFVERRSFRELGAHALVATGAFASPLLAFELYKLVALGGPGPYHHNLQETLSFVRSQGIGGPVADRWARAGTYDRAFYRVFGVRASLVALASVVAAARLLRSGGRPHRSVALALGPGVLLSTVWFLFLSLGWTRYFIVTLLASWALVCLAMTTLRLRVAAALGTVLLLALFAVNHEKLPLLWDGLESGIFAKSPALVNALELTSFIDAHAGQARFANQWWATTADLEYYSRRVDVFRRHQLVQDPGEFYVVYDRRFQNRPDAAFDALLATCAPSERSYDPYALLKCRR